MNDTSQLIESGILGENSDIIDLQSREDNRLAAYQLARKARHYLLIFTHSLDPDVYDNDDMESALFELARRHRTSEIRILVQDSVPAVQRGHRIIRLAQKLTSSIAIRKPAEQYRDVATAYMTADGSGIIYRAMGDEHNYEGYLSYMSAQHASEVEGQFNEIWEHSTPDPQLRRLFV